VAHQPAHQPSGQNFFYIDVKTCSIVLTREIMPPLELVVLGKFMPQLHRCKVCPCVVQPLQAALPYS
jgi:hypothetical protein